MHCYSFCIQIVVNYLIKEHHDNLHCYKINWEGFCKWISDENIEKVTFIYRKSIQTYPCSKINSIK